jgi:hypothetical protein
MLLRAIYLVTGIGLVLAASCQAAPPTGEADASWDRLLVAGVRHGKMQIINRAGEEVWSMQSREYTCDAWMLSDGNIIYASKDKGTKIIKPDLEKGQGAELIWHRPVPEGCETHSCQPLDGGYFLIGENYDGVSYLVEVNRKGHERKRVELRGLGDKHGTWRNVRKTPQGTYLVGGQGEGYKGRRAMEVDGDGKVIRRFPGGGFVAVRLPDGHTLLSSGSGHWGESVARIFETDPEGKIVWKLENKDLPEGVKLGFTCGVQRLPNGNTLICNGKFNMGPNANPGPAVFEITREKKIVWSWGQEMKNHVTNVMVLDREVIERGSWR